MVQRAGRGNRAAAEPGLDDQRRRGLLEASSKRGKLLGITPDLLAEPGQGVETCIFGRPARLHGGAFAIAISARAPMIRLSLPLAIRFERGGHVRPRPPHLSMPAIVMPPFAPVCRIGAAGLRRSCEPIRRTGYSGSTNAGHASCARPRARRCRMNILITLGVAASGLCLLWAVQSVALKLAGEPLAWPLRFTTRKPLVRWTSRVMIHMSWLIILVGTPLALGIRPLDALHQAFPMPVPGATLRSLSRSCFFRP